MSLRKYFDTGKPHQNAVIKWAVGRLAAKDGHSIKYDGKTHRSEEGRKFPQRGVIFADGVGLGKTWEAMGTVISLLAEKGKRTKSGEMRARATRKLKSVLVLCPPALLDNWADEWAAISGSMKKQSFSGGHSHVAETCECIHVLKSALSAKKKREGWENGGIVIAKYGVICNAHHSQKIRNHKWDIVVVDEAHNKKAIAALSGLKFLKKQEKGSQRQDGTKLLLLSATPFQLSPDEWDKLASWVAPGLKLMRGNGPLREFSKKADAAFNGDQEVPSSDVHTIKKKAEGLLRQFVVRCEVKRQHRTRHMISMDGVNGRDIRKAMLDATETNWRKTCLGGAISLNENDRMTYIKKAWREKKSRSLTMEFRLAALENWALEVFEADIKLSFDVGPKMPRKTLVFTEFTQSNGQIHKIAQALDSAFKRAWKSVTGDECQIPNIVVKHCGGETGLSKQAEDFRSPDMASPWVMVASRVGAEGINLHTYTHRLVHFDLAWNPAVMEQREGRMDRLGRKLKEEPKIYYLIVKDTYDERIFHRLLMRQKWHDVFLPNQAAWKKGHKQEDELDDKRIIRGQGADFVLNLDPRRVSR